MRLINADELYEKACDLEAQALSHVEKIMHDEEKHEEWKIWSAILAERSAFKHDVFDAPTIEPERETATWIIDCGYPQHCWCSNCNHRFDLFDPKSIHFCPNCGREMKTCVWKSLDEREIS